MKNKLSYFRVGDLVMVDNYPRNITWVGSTYPRVEIDGVDVACKIEDVKQIPMNVHFLEMNGWMEGENERGIYTTYTKGNAVIKSRNGGNFSLEYYGNKIKNNVRTISQLQHILTELIEDDNNSEVSYEITNFKYKEQ